jgi:hypothetical protein
MLCVQFFGLQDEGSISGYANAARAAPQPGRREHLYRPAYGEKNLAAKTDFDGERAKDCSEQ